MNERQGITMSKKALLALAVGFASTGVVLTGSAAVASEPPAPMTTVEKNLTVTFVDSMPSCEFGGPLYSITMTSDRILEVTRLEDEVRGQMVQSGSFVAVPLGEPSLPSYEGKVNIHNRFVNDADGHELSATFTYDVHGTGSDGSRLDTYFQRVMRLAPDGTVKESLRCH
jgi:hypothetical protein